MPIELVNSVFFVHYARDSVLTRVCFTILAMEGTPKLKKKKEAKAKEGEMAEHKVTTKVVSGIHLHLWPCTVIALPIYYTDQIS
jgi:hypothetical protein